MIARSTPAQHLLAALLVLALAGTGCQSPDAGADGDGAETARYQVSVESTPFYRLGPQQEAGADMQLTEGTRVTMLDRGFGFSNVELDNGWTGWLATADVEPAPPEPEIPMATGSDNIEGNAAIVGRFSPDDVPADFQPADLPDPDTAFPETSLLDPHLEPVEIPEFRY